LGILSHNRKEMAKLKIELKICEPNDNTNTPHGSIMLSTDNKYAYIEIDDKPIAVSVKEFYKAVCALCE